MSASVRSYLVAGAAAATATAIVLTPVQATPADVAVPAHPTSSQPQLTQAMIDLLAAASRMTAAVNPKQPGETGAAFGVAPAAAVTGEVGVQNAASDWLTSAYQFIQYWVDYGVELAQWVAWDLLWFVPFSGLVGDQIGLFYYDLIEPIANSIFYDLIVPVVDAPLNLGVWVNGIGDAIGSSIGTAIDFGVAELNYFFGWLIPPLPPLPGLATTQTLAASLAAPTLRDVIGDVVLPPSDFLTDLAVNTVDGAYGVVQNATGFVVNGADDVLDALHLHFLSRQLDINYTLLSALTEQGVGLTTDLLRVPDNYLNDVLRDGQGLFQAAGTEARYIADSVTDRGTHALNAVGNYIDDQVDYFTPGLTTTTEKTQEVADVPASVRASLQAPAQKPKDTLQDERAAVTATDAQTSSGLAKSDSSADDPATNGRSRQQSRFKDAIGNAKDDDSPNATRTGVRSGTPKAAKQKSTSSKHATDNRKSGHKRQQKNDKK
ncbi:hypothetical protein [[Mycobacterium] fortunisiensis]|nr:hypothetical protein [[Mycobacterium] fortunisiensis]